MVHCHYKYCTCGSSSVVLLITLCRLTTEYSLNASVQTSVDDVSRVDKKVGCHSKVCGIGAASIFSLYFLRTAIVFRILRILIAGADPGFKKRGVQYIFYVTM